MAGISGQGTTFNLPNYVGELFATSPQDTPFLSAIGGLTGGQGVKSTHFTWQTYDLRDASATRQRNEGANAPTADARVRANVTNVVEIHQEALEVSYSKLAATGQFGGTGATNAAAVSIAGDNPVMDEVDWQVQQHLKQVARDVENTFINGTFSDPADTNAPRKTRGLIDALSTNVEDASGSALDRDLFLDLVQSVWAAGGLADQGTAVVMCGGTQKRKLTDIFVTNAGYRQDSRVVGGVSVDTILTDFGTLGVMLNRYVPDDVVLVVSLDQCAPKFLEIPGKGHFFVEPLAKAGSAERWQIYGEIGLKYGAEQAHGIIENLATTAGSGS